MDGPADTEAEKKKQDELKAQYEKEQDLYVNKSLVSKESKEKLSVNFMYEPPPGMKKEREREDGEPEFKFEWQRKYNAPREDYCKGDEDIQDQPFGIAVRNVRCIKCHTWGHVNTDRECPMFNKARDEYDEAIASQQPASNDKKLLNDMKETGLAMTRSAINTLEQMQVPMQELNKKKEELPEEDLAFLKTLSTKDKKKLLKKLEKLENKDKAKKKKKDKKKRKKSPSSSESSSSSSPPTPEPVREKKVDKYSSNSQKHETARYQSSDRNNEDFHRSRGKREIDEDDRRAEYRNREDSYRSHSKHDNAEDDRHSRRRHQEDTRSRGKRQTSPEFRDRREDSRKRRRHDSGDRSNSPRRH